MQGANDQDEWGARSDETCFQTFDQSGLILEVQARENDGASLLHLGQ